MSAPEYGVRRNGSGFQGWCSCGWVQAGTNLNYSVAEKRLLHHLSVNHTANGTCACPKPAIDAAHLHRQREWSRQTFGPGRRTQGVLDHIRKELVEIEDNPESDEWVDVVILALDGAWRHGMEPQQIIDAIRAKQAKNEARVWPDWRLSDEDHAIEHDRSFDA